jgi:hypothetical protein
MGVAAIGEELTMALVCRNYSVSGAICNLYDLPRTPGRYENTS